MRTPCVAILIAIWVGPAAAGETVRVLTVGNSFAENALKYLPQIVEASGNELIVGRANLGGCTLERHWNHVAKFEADPDDPAGSPYSKGKLSLDALLKKEKWDFVTIQQVSYRSHDLTTYSPFAESLHHYISERAPEAEILAHQIWAYRVDDPRFTPKNEGKEPHTQKVMYEQVRQAYHTLAKQLDLGILPSGDAMFMADNDTVWGFWPDPDFDAKNAVHPALPEQAHSLHVGWFWKKGDNDQFTLRMDGHHASQAGQYLLGCVWFERLFGQSVIENSYVPKGFDPEYAKFLRETAHKAVAASAAAGDGGDSRDPEPSEETDSNQCRDSEDEGDPPAEIRDWSHSDFKKGGHVQVLPKGEQSEQLRLWGWPETTHFDMRGATYLAHENGPFDADALPDKYPTGSELNEFRECVTQEKYPVSIRGRGGRNVLLSGPRVIGVQPRELPWRIMKRFYDGDGVRIEAPGDLIVDGAFMDNVQDGFSPRGGGYWVLRNSHLKYVRDDFVENDGLLSGEITNCLAEGVFVFLSARPGKNADPEKLDARTPPVVRIRNTLVHLEAMPFDGDMKLKNQRFIKDCKACGQLFKWSRWAGTVEVSDCVFRWDQMSASGPTPMKFPEGTYENVTLIWLGEGDFPQQLPNGVTLSRDVRIWDRAREDWLKRNQDSP